MRVPPPVGAVDGERAADGRDAVGRPRRPARRVGTADAVVRDHQRSAPFGRGRRSRPGRPACLATFASASAATKYAAVSTPAGAGRPARCRPQRDGGAVGERPRPRHPGPPPGGSPGRGPARARGARRSPPGSLRRGVQLGPPLSGTPPRAATGSSGGTSRGPGVAAGRRRGGPARPAGARRRPPPRSGRATRAPRRAAPAGRPGAARCRRARPTTAPTVRTTTGSSSRLSSWTTAPLARPRPRWRWRPGRLRRGDRLRGARVIDPAASVRRIEDPEGRVPERLPERALELFATRRGVPAVSIATRRGSRTQPAHPQQQPERPRDARQPPIRRPGPPSGQDRDGRLLLDEPGDGVRARERRPQRAPDQHRVRHPVRPGADRAAAARPPVRRARARCRRAR